MHYNELVNVNLTFITAAHVGPYAPHTVPSGHSMDTSDILWSFCVNLSNSFCYMSFSCWGLPKFDTATSEGSRWGMKMCLKNKEVNRCRRFFYFPIRHMSYHMFKLSGHILPKQHLLMTSSLYEVMMSLAESHHRCW